jgi:four helix bundle protein
VIEQLPRGRSHIADQLHRATTSIVLNIAEELASFSKPAKRRYYKYPSSSPSKDAQEIEGYVDIAEDGPVPPKLEIIEALSPRAAPPGTVATPSSPASGPA